MGRVAAPELTQGNRRLSVSGWRGRHLHGRPTPTRRPWTSSRLRQQSSRWPLTRMRTSTWSCGASADHPGGDLLPPSASEPSPMEKENDLNIPAGGEVGAVNRK
eukprot:6583218-Prymnesium_polylepis.1